MDKTTIYSNVTTQKLCAIATVNCVCISLIFRFFYKHITNKILHALNYIYNECFHMMSQWLGGTRTWMVLQYECTFHPPYFSMRVSYFMWMSKLLLN